MLILWISWAKDRKVVKGDHQNHNELMFSGVEVGVLGI